MLEASRCCRCRGASARSDGPPFTAGSSGAPRPPPLPPRGASCRLSNCCQSADGHVRCGTAAWRPCRPPRGRRRGPGSPLPRTSPPPLTDSRRRRHAAAVSHRGRVT